MSSDFCARFTGVLPALATPLTDGGEVDGAAVRRLVRHVIDGGASGIWALGSGGEFASLTFEQRRTLLQAAADEAAGRVPVVGGVSDSCVARVMEYAAAAKDAGADAVFATTPFYYTLTTDEVVRFYLALADRSPLPLVVYHNPFNARGRLDAQSVRPLAEHANIAGIKDSSCDLGFFQEMLDAVGGRADFRLFQGHDPLVPAAALMGADGAVMAAALVAPRLVVSLFNAARAQDVATVNRLSRQVRKLDAIFSIDGPTDGSFLGGQKAALELLGLCSRRTAPPFQPLDDAKVRQIREILLEAGVLRK